MLGLCALPVARVSNAHPGPFAVMAESVRSQLQPRVRCAYPGYRVFEVLRLQPEQPPRVGGGLRGNLFFRLPT